MQYFGRAKVYFNGKLLDTEPGAKITLGGIERKPREGVHKVGFSEARKAAMVECEVGLSKETPIDEIRNLVDATITFETDTGQRWIVKNAFTAELLTATEGEGGKVPVKFAGDPAEAA